MAKVAKIWGFEGSKSGVLRGPNPGFEGSKSEVLRGQNPGKKVPESVIF